MTVKRFFIIALQLTWGLPQTLLGLILLLRFRGCPRSRFRESVCVHWQGRGGMSLGLFLFVPEDPSAALLVHEYGHTVQSLLLGPLYLILIGIPSTLWGFLPACARKRKEKQLSYFSFFTEKWANRWGEKVTGEASMEQLVID
jgi:hypothetical protein